MGVLIGHSYTRLGWLGICLDSKNNSVREKGAPWACRTPPLGGAYK